MRSTRAFAPGITPMLNNRLKFSPEEIKPVIWLDAPWIRSARVIVYTSGLRCSEMHMMQDDKDYVMHCASDLNSNYYRLVLWRCL